MAYIGAQPKSVTYLVDTFSGNASDVNFTLRVEPVSKAALLVFVDGSRKTTNEYSVVGNVLTFNSAPGSGTNNIQVVFLGLYAAVNITTDASISTNKLVDQAVTTDKIADNAVTSAKIAPGTVIAADILDGTVDNNKLVSANITGDKLVANTITSRELAANLSISGNLTVQQTVIATDFNSTSDIALKENLTIIIDPISTINKLNGFSFNWKSNGQKSYGLTAQDVEKVLPEIVQTRENGYKGINYLNIIAFLIESVKDLQKQINDLKK